MESFGPGPPSEPGGRLWSTETYRSISISRFRSTSLRSNQDFGRNVNESFDSVGNFVSIEQRLSIFFG